jgi:hypothetical protein
VHEVAAQLKMILRMANTLSSQFPAPGS